MFRKKVKKILISSSFLISSTSVCILSSSCDSIFNPFSPAFNLLFYMKEVENGERIEQTAKINSFDEFKNLCSDGRADYEISGVTIPRNNVCGIKFAATGLFADGSKLSYIPNNFLYNCKAEY
jgi:hypothetical protein